MKRAMLLANSASMIDHFNRDNLTVLESLGYSVVVAANFDDGNSSTDEKIATFRKELLERKVEILNLPIPRSLRKLKDAFSAIKMLRRYLSKNPCELIHTQTPFGGVVGRLAALPFRKRGTKVIYFVHGFHFFKGAPIKNYIFYYPVERILSKCTDCMISLNREDYQVLKKQFRHPHTYYVPGIGVDTKNIAEWSIPDKAALLNEFSIPENAPIVLVVAELIPRKNLVTAIDAFAKVTDKSCHLILCGKGELLDALTARAKELDLFERVHFAGYREDIFSFYSLADVFLFTSHQEGLSVAMMQAMAAKLPIVASDIRGNRDLLQPYRDCECKNYLVAPDDVDGFAKKLNELLASPSKRQKLGEQNYKNCQKYFDISIVHKKMETIYKNTLELSE